MADTYIDYDETRIYGDYAIDQIARHLIGRMREFDPALQFAVAALRDAGELVAAHLYAARVADPSLHALVAAREAPMTEARDTLVRFAHHLDSHRAGVVAVERFFVEAPHTLSRRGPVRLLAALDHVLGTLDEHSATVRDAAWWRAELVGARAGLEVVVANERKVRSANVSNPTLATARDHWLNVYNAAKSLVAALLALSGSTLPLDEVFDDLAATHRADGALDDLHPELEA